MPKMVNLASFENLKFIVFLIIFSVKIVHFLPIFFKSITKFHMEFYASSTFFQQVTNEDVKVCNDYMQYQNRKPVLLLQLI